MKKTRSDFLTAAHNAICGERDEQYGAPEENFSTIAELWTTYVKRRCVGDANVCITAEDVAVMMCLLKIARIAGGQAHDDNWTDAIGYMACGGEVARNWAVTGSKEVGL